jgi:REP element-mobilizing transposase RayT
MATKQRCFVVGEFHHVYNRAVDKRTIFYTEKDYEYFLGKALFFKEKTGVKIIAYCILPNHWHFLLKEPGPVFNQTGWTSQISRFISLLSNSYTKYFNLNKDHSGRIFQGPFKSKLVQDDNYLRVLIRYINLNPIKHKIVKKIEDWPYVSHHNYIGKEKYNLIDKDYLIDFEECKNGLKDYLFDLKSIDEEF